MDGERLRRAFRTPRHGGVAWALSARSTNQPDRYIFIYFGPSVSRRVRLLPRNAFPLSRRLIVQKRTFFCDTLFDGGSLRRNPSDLRSRYAQACRILDGSLGNSYGGTSLVVMSFAKAIKSMQYENKSLPIFNHIILYNNQ